MPKKAKKRSPPTKISSRANPRPSPANPNLQHLHSNPFSKINPLEQEAFIDLGKLPPALYTALVFGLPLFLIFTLAMLAFAFFPEQILDAGDFLGQCLTGGAGNNPPAAINAVACPMANLTQDGNATLLANNHTLSVEVVTQYDSIQRGLMYRESLCADCGMLFVYAQAAPRSHWMKNTFIPLDIVYLGEDQRVLNIQHAVPCTADPCPGYPAQGDAKYVLEINAGKAQELGLKTGDQLFIEK